MKVFKTDNVCTFLCWAMHVSMKINSIRRTYQHLNMRFQWNQWKHLGRLKIHRLLPSWGFNVIGLSCDLGRVFFKSTSSSSKEQPKLSTSFPHDYFQRTGHHWSSCCECLFHSCLSMPSVWVSVCLSSGLDWSRFSNTKNDLFFLKGLTFQKNMWLVVLGFYCCHNELPPI